MMRRRSLHEAAHKVEQTTAPQGGAIESPKRSLNEAAHKLGHVPVRQGSVREELELATSPAFDPNENRDVIAAGGRMVLALAALGVVYGDIGTSPLYTEQVIFPANLALARKRGVLERNLDLEHASYFLSRIHIIPTAAPSIPRWRKKLFVVMARNAASPVDHFGLPGDRTVEVGSQISL